MYLAPSSLFLRIAVIGVIVLGSVFSFIAISVSPALAQSCGFGGGYTCHGTYVATGGGGTCYGYITQEASPTTCEGEGTGGGGGGGGGFVNSDPIGSLDVAGCSAGGVGGWAFDDDAPNAPIDVHFYAGGSFVGSVTADQYRGDLGAYGNAQHGFSWSLPESYKNGNTYTLTAYAINTPGGNNPVIGSRTFQCSPPAPVVPDAPTGLYATCSASGTSVSFGWNASAGTTYYAPRVNPTAQGECSGFGWQIWSGDGQTCLAPGDQYYGTSVSGFPTIPGKSYSMWVHAVNAGGVSGANSVGFTCSAPPQPPPQPTDLSASCNAEGTQVTMSWSASPGASFYYYRNSSSDSSCAAGWNGTPSTNCYPNPDSVTGTSITYPSTPGRTYNWWVHSANGAGYSNPSYGAITCPGQPVLTGLVGSPENAIINQSKTLYGAVRNDGTGAAGAFPNVMQICNGGCASYNQTISASSISSLAVGAQQNISASFTPTVNGALYYRVCANRSTSVPNDGAYAGCSGWQNLNVYYPEQSFASCSMNATVGQYVPITARTQMNAYTSVQTLITWGDNTANTTSGWYTSGRCLDINASGCNGTHNTDGSNEFGWQHIYTQPGTYVINVDMVNGNLGGYLMGANGTWANDPGPISCTVNVTGSTDLTASAGPAASATIGQALVLSGTVSNIGNVAAGYFPNFIQVCNSAVTVCDTVMTNAVSSLAAGASTPVSGSYTPSTQDRTLYRTCANYNESHVNVHTESNYGNNCSSWQSLAVSAQTFPDLTVGSVPTVYGTIGQAITVTGTASNIGNASTGAGFNNMFVTNLNAQQTAWNTVRDGSSSAALGVGGFTSFTTTFPAGTFATAGSYYYAYCTDLNSSWAGTINESNENNNCSGWGTIVVQGVDITAATSGTAQSVMVNQSATLTGTVSNIGAAAAGYFPNFFQVCDNNCATVNTNVNATAVNSLAAGASQAVSASYTPTQVTQYYFRVCGNFNTSWVNVHTESNYDNNCGAWQSLVSNAVPTATLTVSPSSVSNGGSTTVSWSSSGATSCTGTNFSTGNATSGSVTASSLTQTTTFTVNCSGPGGNASDAKTVTVSPAIPTGLSATCNAAGTQVTMSWNTTPGATFYYYRNLSSDSTCAPGFQGNPSSACYPNPDSVSGTSVTYPTTPGRTYDWWVHSANSSGYSNAAYGAITCSGQADLTAVAGAAASATAGQSITLSGTVSNIGSAAAGYFPNFIQICDAATTCGTLNTDSSRTATAVNSLAAGASTGVSTTYTTTSSGNLIYRVCTNLNGSWVNVHAESNYSNNCSGWQNLTVTAPNASAPSVNLTASPSAIGQGSASTLSWSSSGAQVCTSPDFDTDGTTGGSVSVSPAATKTYSLTCTATSPSPSGTWNYKETDTSDLSCPVSQNSSVYSGVPNCPANPQGQACSGSPGTCKINRANQAACTIETDIYTCEGAGGTGASQSLSDTETITVTQLPPAPTGLSASCNADGTLATFSWNATPGATFYYPRASAGSCPSGWVSNGAGVCSPSANSTTATSITFGTTPGTTYSWWVHGANSAGYGPETYSTVTCAGQVDVTAATGAAQTVVAGQAISLPGTVSNIGSATATSFPNITQVCSSSGCNISSSIVSAASVTSLAPGASVAVSGSQTPSTAGSYLYRICANFNTTPTNVITESNYGNNCGAWQTLTVQAPVPGMPSGLSASCNVSGTQATLSWTPTPNATAYHVRMDDPTNNAAGCTDGWYCSNPPDKITDNYAATSITYDIVAGRSYNWWVHAANGTGYSNPTNAGFNCAGQADLTATPGAAASTLTGSSVTLMGTVSNIGNGAAGYFPNFIQVCDAGTTCGVINTDSSRTATAVNSLAASASTGVSATYTPTSNTSLIYRVCTNLNSSWVNVQTESNYGNNCSGWQTLSVIDPIPPSVSCNVSPTSIQSGEQVTYTASPNNGANAPYTWTSSDNASFGSGTVVNRTLTIPGIYTMNVSAEGTAVGNCPNVTVEASWCTNASTDLSIVATPNRVRAGNPVNLTWSASGVNGEGATCTVTGPGVSWSSAVSLAPVCSASGSASPRIDTQSVYTLTCGSQTESVIVNVIPNFEEF